jgi:hypothetical protein
MHFVKLLTSIDHLCKKQQGNVNSIIYHIDVNK